MKYQVFALYSGTRFLGEVEADTQEAAEMIALELPHGLEESEYLTELRVQPVVERAK
jgi:hypothetical protein